MLKHGLRTTKLTLSRAMFCGLAIAALSACQGGTIGKNRSSSSTANTTSSQPASTPSSVASPSSNEAVSSLLASSSSAQTQSSELLISSAASSISSTASGYTTLDPNIITGQNPFDGAHFYLSPDITTLIDGSIAKLDPTSADAQKLATLKKYPSAVWLDRIEAITGGSVNGGRHSLGEHLDEAKAQQLAKVQNGVLPPMTIVIVVYNLPDRDCAAAASNGTLHSNEDGMLIYQQEYIDVIAEQFRQFPNIRIVAMLEPDSYPNMITNLHVEACRKVADKKVYVKGIQYAINKFADMPNVYTYIDIAHSGWLGWDNNRAKAVTGFTNLVKGATTGGKLNVIRGFASNTANYTPLSEPFIDASSTNITDSSFYSFNHIVDENNYIDALHSEFVAQGFPSSLGFIVDTARNGWGGSERPTQNDGTVNSRIDRRNNRGSWCNVDGAGIGERPQAHPDATRPYIDAYFWMKPPGESDGIADSSATTANIEGKSYDPNCGSGNADAMSGAPHAGHWFHEQLLMLVQNAYPPIELTSVTPPVESADDDRDGVVNEADKCPNTATNATVDIQGCSAEQLRIDTDNDGVDDDADACPNTAAGATVNNEGCSEAQLFVDTDNDNVNDANDLCLETPANAVVNTDGCAASQLDADQDTVTDDKDTCPKTPSGETANNQGCSPSQLDSDNDGVSDASDMCADTIAGATVDAQGCSADQNFVDTDNDGVEDGKDQCLSTPAGEAVNTAGCAASERDTDNDTVTDNNDVCANTPSGETADSTGCSDSQRDSDKDTIADNIDQCASTPAGETANSVGCSPSQLDTDNDGVKDNADKCSDTPSTESADIIGCSASQSDSDKDTIADNIDQCPSTPAGEIANSEGCSPSQVDSDNDGIFNNADTCANTPTGETANAAGCSSSQVDSDKDGIKDAQDICANTPAGETANNQGCAPSQLDTDNDGVKDNLDKCSSTPSAEQANAQGCSASQTDSDGDTVSDSDDICAATPLGEPANTQGCSASQRDTDNDGIKDNADKCLTTPANASVNSQGCAASERDTDNDGIVDANDNCASTPATEQANPQGCSPSQLDDDNDGVNNALDKCLTTPANAATNTQGCADSEIDSDNDGVSNANDLCAATTANSSVNIDGCAPYQLDTDNDGINDRDDQCANSAAGWAINGVGCTASQLTGNTQTGANLWTSENCALCHGNFVNDKAASRKIDPQNLTKTTNAGLANYIAKYMPSEANPCDDQCAADVAAFIRTLPQPPADSDSDGVIDNNDSCPNTGAGLAVNSAGCHLDQLTGNAQQGKTIWEAGTVAKCSTCHGNSAAESGAAIPIDPQNLTKTSPASIVSYIDANMQQLGTACKGQCAADVAAYLLTFTKKAGPTQAQIDARVEAGRVLYSGESGGNSCSGCHGADGKLSIFDVIADTTKTYSEIVTLLNTGKGSMPSCKPAGNCATQLADYIWVNILGLALTSEGGTR